KWPAVFGTSEDGRGGADGCGDERRGVWPLASAPLTSRLAASGDAGLSVVTVSSELRPSPRFHRSERCPWRRKCALVPQAATPLSSRGGKCRFHPLASHPPEGPTDVHQGGPRRPGAAAC